MKFHYTHQWEPQSLRKELRGRHKISCGCLSVCRSLPIHHLSNLYNFYLTNKRWGRWQASQHALCFWKGLLLGEYTKVIGNMEIQYEDSEEVYKEMKNAKGVESNYSLSNSISHFSMLCHSSFFHSVILLMFMASLTLSLIDHPQHLVIRLIMIFPSSTFKLITELKTVILTFAIFSS